MSTLKDIPVRRYTMDKRYKNVVLTATQLSGICPFKPCGMAITISNAKKGDIIKCPNCQREIKVKKILA
jgi:hypothetical protein